MSVANDLITRLERETGHRIDEEDSPAMAGLLGAMSRKMGLSPETYQERDDVAAGTAIQAVRQDNNNSLAVILLALLTK